MSQERIDLIIPVRAGSKGILNKNLLKINGISLVERSFNMLKACKLIDNIIISTDSPEIKLIFEKEKNVIIHDRPKILASDKASTESVVEDVIHKIKNLNEFLGFYQVTNQFLKSEDIDGSIKMLIENKYNSLFTSYKCHSFIWEKKNFSFEGVNHSPLKKRKRRQEIREQYLIEDGGLYCFNKNLFLKNKNRFIEPVGSFITNNSFIVEIDEKNDLEITRKLLKNE